MKSKKDFFGVNEVAALFKVDPTTVRYWCSRGLLYYDRTDQASRRRIYPETLVAFIRERNTPEETLDQEILGRVKDAAAATCPVIDYPRVLVVDVEGRVRSVSRGIGYLLGYEESDIIGSQVDMKMTFRDEELGAPLLFRALDRLTVEPSRASWGSYNSEGSGRAWITPLRTGDSDICGWAISLE